VEEFLYGSPHDLYQAGEKANDADGNFLDHRLNGRFPCFGNLNQRKSLACGTDRDENPVLLPPDLVHVLVLANRTLVHREKFHTRRLVVLSSHKHESRDKSAYTLPYRSTKGGPVGFLEDVSSSETEPAPKCPIAILIIENPTLGYEVDEAINAKDDGGSYFVNASSIAKMLRSKNFRIGDDAVRRHRRGDCRCNFPRRNK